MEHYNALSPYLKNRFGCKICKLSLSAGCTCPNRDGTLGTRGCMFCSGSGEFAASRLASIPEQLEQAKLILGKKAHNARFIAYFQEFTNTYGDVSRLEPLFLPGDGAGRCRRAFHCHAPGLSAGRYPSHALSPA